MYPYRNLLLRRLTLEGIIFVMKGWTWRWLGGHKVYLQTRTRGSNQGRYLSCTQYYSLHLHTILYLSMYCTVPRIHFTVLHLYLSIHCTVYRVYCTHLYTVHGVPYLSIQCPECTVPTYTLYRVYCTYLYTVQGALYLTIHCTVGWHNKTPKKVKVKKN